MSEPRLQRVALVTPYAWSTPHAVNDHIAELATGLCDLAQTGTRAPEVVVIAPTLDPRARSATRRALREIARGDDVAGVLLADELRAHAPGERRRSGSEQLEFPLLSLGYAMGNANVVLRSNLRLLMERGGFDLVHVHDPFAGGITRHVVRHWPGLTVATFHDAPSPGLIESLAAPLRERLVEQLDMVCVPGTYVADQLAMAGIELADPQPIATIAANAGAQLQRERFAAARTLIVVGRGDEDDAVVKSALAALEPLASEDSGTEIALMSRWDSHHRPRESKAWRGRLHNAQVATRAEADELLARASAYVWLPGTHSRSVLEARAAGVPVVAALDGETSTIPGDIADAIAAGNSAADVSAALVAPCDTAAELAATHIDAWERLAGRRQVHIPAPTAAQKTCVIDLHMHTSHSWDCATDPEALLYAAKKIGLTAVAVTDHNEVSGGLACAELAEEYGIQVIVGEEVKTAEGEVIGLFLSEKIEAGLSWEETIRQIRAQDGLVYVPHPFDRLHTIPSAQTLRDSIDEIDAFEVYNARLAFEQYNRDAQRFARKYNLVEGAGSDAHVPQGLGTGAVAMPAWDDRESFLQSLAQGEILRRPKNLLYIQGLKWINDMTGKSKLSPVPADPSE